LILAAGLFIAWIGFLGLLAATSSRPNVLLRPQFMVSEVDVIAQLNGPEKRPDPAATVEEVRWPNKELNNLIGKNITILNLDKCEGWEGPGQYILPLQKRFVPNQQKEGQGTFAVAAPGMSPGFEPSKVRPRIYRVSPETLRQLNTVLKSK
jgi:hypothetical protein